MASPEMKNPYNDHSARGSQDKGKPVVSFSDPGSSDSKPALGQPANINMTSYPQQQPVASLWGAFQPPQPMASATPIWPSQGQLPLHPGSPSVPENQFQPPQHMFAPGIFPGAPPGSPWPMPGQFPLQTGIQPTGTASPIQQAQQSTTASPAVFGGPRTVNPTCPPLQPASAAPGSFPQPGQQFPGGNASSPSQGQAVMHGMPPWAMTGLPPMPTSPQMTGSQTIDPSQAQQVAMYQQYMQALPWQFGPGGVQGWPPPLMYSMYPNAYPGFPTSPPAPPATVSPTSNSSKSPPSPSTSPGPGPSASPPPYNESKRSNKSQDPSRNTNKKSGDVVNQGDASFVPHFSA